MLMVLVAGMMLTVGIQLIQSVIFPWGATLPVANSQLEIGPPARGIFLPVVSVVVGIGGVLFGVVTIRSRVYSRPLGIGFIVLAVVSFVLGFLNLPGALGSLGEVVYMVALAWTGLELWLGIANRPAVDATAMETVQAPKPS